MEDTGGRLTVSLSDGTISPESITSTHLTPGKYVIIEISDTGKGIPQQDIKAIFDPYFTTKTPAGGTGLGLSTVHGIVKNYGGKITVKSQVNKGSIFRVYMPVVPNQDDNTTKKDEPIPKGTERLLFIDDEPAIANVGKQILSRLGYAVTAKTDSLEALETFHSKPDAFDLVITDMTMPRMTGEKLSTELIKIRPDIPVILLTGYNKKISEDQAFEMGIKAFAYKPIMISQLAEIVRTVLDKQQKE
jgi:CheY-like chemotaxis protein